MRPEEGGAGWHWVALRGIGWHVRPKGGHVLPQVASLPRWKHIRLAPDMPPAVGPENPDEGTAPSDAAPANALGHQVVFTPPLTGGG